LKKAFNPRLGVDGVFVLRADHGVEHFPLAVIAYEATKESAGVFFRVALRYQEFDTLIEENGF
jgi:hypothetical protein